MNPVSLAWLISALATAGVITRPFGWPEATWAVSGALLLVVLNLLPAAQALDAVAKGGDVYLFLTGMMLLSEAARREGLFDWVATHVVNLAQGSPRRLFALIYGVGVVTTVFLSNDATAVVLTPAVLAAARRAKANPMPLLYSCALVANAASFVLPISNPANLVLYGAHMPALGVWLAHFAAPSVASIVCTFVMLRIVQRRALSGHCESALPVRPLTRGGRIALAGIAATAVALMAVSVADRPLGLPTALAGVVTVACVAMRDRAACVPIVREISWSVLPLVAGLFVVVETLDRTGAVRALAGLLHMLMQSGEHVAAAVAGVAVALVSNGVNNLPAGLIASSTIHAAHSPQTVVDAILIGVDLGPNLSITGSLATILWLAAIRREGLQVGFREFLAVGACVMPPALLLALGARFVIGG
ncbi:arsenic transporter [Burkholderia contaminans FFH2055]|uniref:arsenic transporter n=1 Tax=Burkholderia contaminans TaxID=488447 RepID=UPI000625F69D|nr:arsenic transporter [Burkholderia contaminans]KKL35278.1 arsenic transporter [Burkholderia contaminans FFH2055]MEB4639968.1 arsenic transporter [Burkholderia contaminans]MEB4654542.1 arsenic transporter [Burkholderia contaminans]MEB4659086.1 arsenic transporter [Burkholderia contaminans]MEB4669866.1 arsenic transporter [Burkholderia contaminans]